MSESHTPVDLIQEYALTFSNVVVGQPRNQTSFAAGKTKFLFIGPGAKGQGFKAMCK